MALTDFVGFPKIPRMHAPCIITEKIDGTNAQILIVGPSPGEPKPRYQKSKKVT